jgi:hypothetical protein
VTGRSLTWQSRPLQHCTEGGILSPLLRTWQPELSISPQGSLACQISARFQMNVTHVALTILRPGPRISTRPEFAKSQPPVFPREKGDLYATNTDWVGGEHLMAFDPSSTFWVRGRKDPRFDFRPNFRSTTAGRERCEQLAIQHDVHGCGDASPDDCREYQCVRQFGKRGSACRRFELF